MHDFDYSIFEESEIESIVENEEEKTYDITLSDHHMLFANDIYTHNSGINAEVITMESISEAFNKCFVADFIFSLSRTAAAKQTNTGRIFIAKNRNGPDGIVLPIFMDTSNIDIQVFSESSETIDDINKNAAQRQAQTLREKYAEHRKQQKSLNNGE